MKQWAGLSLACVALVLLSQAIDVEPLAWVAKPLASMGFLLVAWTAGARSTRFGRWIFAALVFGALGDVILLSREPLFFLAGLVSFLLGHLSFCGAFVARGVRWSVAVAALALLVSLDFVVMEWLLPHVRVLSAGMVVPVFVYMSAITAMVSLAAGTVAKEGAPWILVAAVAFFCSDLSVSREAFVAPGLVNALWGLPLDHVAQLLFASSVRR